jgi:hypothetical protein
VGSQIGTKDHQPSPAGKGKYSPEQPNQSGICNVYGGAQPWRRIPSSAFLAVALGAIGLSLLGQLGGRGKWGNFVADWVPTLLIMGVYI